VQRGGPQHGVVLVAQPYGHRPGSAVDLDLVEVLAPVDWDADLDDLARLVEAAATRTGGSRSGS